MPLPRFPLLEAEEEEERGMLTNSIHVIVSERKLDKYMPASDDQVQIMPVITASFCGCHAEAQPGDGIIHHAGTAIQPKPIEPATLNGVGVYVHFCLQPYWLSLV